MKFNTNSNTYIIIYSVVMVVVVAVLLSLAALGLQDRQQANMLNEKKTQIVKALGEDPATVSYDSVITSAVILDAAGAVVSEDVNEVFAALSRHYALSNNGFGRVIATHNNCNESAVLSINGYHAVGDRRVIVNAIAFF